MRGPFQPVPDLPLGGLARDSRPVRRRSWAGRRRAALLGVLAAAAAAAALPAVRWLRPAAVAVVELTPQQTTRVLAVNGRVRARLTVDLRPRQPGLVVALGKEEGQAVEAGEVIASLDDAPQRELVAQAESALAGRRRELQQTERDLQRSADLVGRGYTPRSSYEKAQLDVERAREDLGRLAAAVREVRSRLAEYQVRAPFAGRVLTRPADPGQVVDAQTVLYRIAAVAEPEAEAEVDELLAGSLRVGMPARIAPGGGDRVLEGHVTFLAPRVDPATGGRVVRLGMAVPPGMDLPVGLTLAISMLVEERDGALVLPRAAIADQRTSPWVLAVEGGRAARRTVGFLDWPGERVLVLSGPGAGALVALDPAAARPGASVRPATR